MLTAPQLSSSGKENDGLSTNGSLEAWLQSNAWNKIIFKESNLLNTIFYFYSSFSFAATQTWIFGRFYVALQHFTNSFSTDIGLMRTKFSRKNIFWCDTSYKNITNLHFLWLNHFQNIWRRVYTELAESPVIDWVEKNLMKKIPKL